MLTRPFSVTTLSIVLCTFFLVFFWASYPSLSNHARVTAANSTKLHDSSQPNITNNHTELIKFPSLPNLINHGSRRCLPSVTPKMLVEAKAWNESCSKHAPFGPSKSRIATVSVSTGRNKRIHRRTLETFMLHSIVQNNDFYVLCDNIIDGTWNKMAFLLKIVMDQMALPKEERYEWILWIDRDAIILDPCRPLETFLPDYYINSTTGHDDLKELFTRDQAENIHMLVNKDGNGLNNGIFLFRVNEWAISLLQNVLAYRFYNKDDHLTFAEQSAQEKIIGLPEFAPNVAWVPAHWFNAYTSESPKMFVEQEDQKNLDDKSLVRRGDFLLHFAGRAEKSTLIAKWLDGIEGLGNVWKTGKLQRDVDGEVFRFWKGYPGSDVKDKDDWA